MAKKFKCHEPLDQRVARILAERAQLTRLYSSKGSSAEILLYDELGAYGTTAREFADELAALGDVKNITVGINSPGGDAFHGLAMFNALVKHPARITTRVDGLAASAASLVVMAGDQVTMADNSYLMIHAPWCLSAGDARDHYGTGDLLYGLTDRYIDTYSTRRNLPRADVSRAVWAETWFDGHEAVDAGFADQVLATPAIAASVKSGRYQHTPAALLKGKQPCTPHWRIAALQRTRDLQLAVA